MLKITLTTLFFLSLLSFPTQALTNACIQRESQQLSVTLRKIQRGTPSLEAIAKAQVKHPNLSGAELMRKAWEFDARVIQAKKQFNSKVQNCR